MLIDQSQCPMLLYLNDLPLAAEAFLSSGVAKAPDCFLTPQPVPEFVHPNLGSPVRHFSLKRANW